MIRADRISITKEGIGRTAIGIITFRADQDGTAWDVPPNASQSLARMPRVSIKIDWSGKMFNMDIMKQGAEAFGKVADGIDAIHNVALAFAIREGLECPEVACPMAAGHYGDHMAERRDRIEAAVQDDQASDGPMDVDDIPF